MQVLKIVLENFVYGHIRERLPITQLDSEFMLTVVSTHREVDEHYRTKVIPWIRDYGNHCNYYKSPCAVVNIFRIYCSMRRTGDESTFLPKLWNRWMLVAMSSPSSYPFLYTIIERLTL